MNVKISYLDKQEVTLRKFSEYLRNVKITDLNFIQHANELESNELIDCTAMLARRDVNNISIDLLCCENLNYEQDYPLEMVIKEHWNKFTSREN